MYVVQDTLLGNTPAPTPAPSFVDSLLNFANAGVSAGFNIFNKVQAVKQTQQQANQAQAQAQALQLMYANQGALAQPVGVQPGMVAYGGSSSSWILPAAVGVGALALIFILKK